jgi:hypothetical protein
MFRFFVGSPGVIRINDKFIKDTKFYLLLFAGSTGVSRINDKFISDTKFYLLLFCYFDRGVSSQL